MIHLITYFSFLPPLDLSRFSRSSCLYGRSVVNGSYFNTWIYGRSVINGLSEPFLEPKPKSEQIAFRENCRRLRRCPCGCIATDWGHPLVPPAMALTREDTASSIFRQRSTHCGGVWSTRPKSFHGYWQVLCTCETLAPPSNSCFSRILYANF